MTRRLFVIVVAGELTPRMQDEFDDVDVTVERGATELRAVGDSSVLHGLLARVDRLGLQLLDVHRGDTATVRPDAEPGSPPRSPPRG